MIAAAAATAATATAAAAAAATATYLSSSLLSTSCWFDLGCCSERRNGLGWVRCTGTVVGIVHVDYF
jgi:hypothetical protein